MIIIAICAYSLVAITLIALTPQYILVFAIILALVITFT